MEIINPKETVPLSNQCCMPSYLFFQPKCKSSPARSACYDLLVEMAKGSLANYMLLHKKLMEQHSSTSHKAYPWEHWPKDDGRSECGYVGLTNLGNIIVFFFIYDIQALLL